MYILITIIVTYHRKYQLQLSFRLDMYKKILFANVSAVKA